MDPRNPISLTGIPRHIGLWLTSSSCDVIYQNPNFIAPNNENSNADPGIAIYCIHGTADRVGAFELFANRILTSLPTPICSIHLTAFNNRARGISINDFAEQLITKITRNKHQKVILFGHSRGGIVAAYAAEYLASTAGINVLACETICSPFKGSDLSIAPLTLISSSVSELTRDSKMLCDLRTKIASSNTKYFYFTAEHDWIVDADSACIDEHKNELIRLACHGHISVMSSHKLVAHALNHVKLICQQTYPHLDNIDVPLSLNRIDIDDQLAPLESAAADIDQEIKRLTSKYEKTSYAKKITVLANLNELLNSMCAGNRGSHYPAAKTVGEFIQAFIDDATLYDGKTRIQILSENSDAWSRFLQQKTTSFVFIEKLIKEYSQATLPMQTEITATHTEINGTP